MKTQRVCVIFAIG